MKSAEQSFFNRDSNVDIPTSSGFEKQNTENSPFVEKKFEYARYPKVMQTMQKFGLNVLSNQESTEEEKNFAKDYLEKLYYEYSSDTEGDIEDKDSWIKYVNEEISKRLTEKVFAFNENSPIYKQRKNLGILDKSQEKAFKIKVL